MALNTMVQKLAGRLWREIWVRVDQVKRGILFPVSVGDAALLFHFIPEIRAWERSGNPEDGAV